jgi:hypothetical protein
VWAKVTRPFAVVTHACGVPQVRGRVRDRSGRCCR